MAYNYGLTGLATVTSGSSQTIAADGAALGGAIRVFDLVLINTAATVNFYAGTNSLAANLVIALDKNNSPFNSNAGIRFNGGVYQSTSVTAGNLAIVNFIEEF